MTGSHHQKDDGVRLDADTAQTQLVLNHLDHGANSGGEEYSRRNHFVYVDDELRLMYSPDAPRASPFASSTQATASMAPPRAPTAAGSPSATGARATSSTANHPA